MECEKANGNQAIRRGVRPAGKDHQRDRDGVASHLHGIARLSNLHAFFLQQAYLWR